MYQKKLSILIPAYNEAKRIRSTISSLKSIPEVLEIIVINDGSIDNTGFYAEKEGARVITLPYNLGKGMALNMGAKYIKGEYVALIDADLGDTAQEITKLFYPVFENEVEIAIAIFPPAVKKGGVGLVKKVSTIGLKLITKSLYQAPLSGQRIMSRNTFESLLPFSAGFGVEVGMTIDAYHKGFKILEIETNMGHAETERNWAGFKHRGNQLREIFYTLARKGWLR